MARILAERVTAEIGDEVCVFLIGLRVNRLWKPQSWVPVACAMRRMLAELEQLPGAGFLGAESWFGNPTLIWHETYRMRRGDFECVYNNVPAFGLAKETKLVPATGRRESAPGRMSER